MSSAAIFGATGGYILCVYVRIKFGGTGGKEHVTTTMYNNIDT